MKRVTWRAPGAARRRSEGGYVAILTILLFTTLFGLCAFAVDVGNWYYTGQRAQRAADAGLWRVSHCSLVTRPVHSPRRGPSPRRTVSTTRPQTYRSTPASTASRPDCG